MNLLTHRSSGLQQSSLIPINAGPSKVQVPMADEVWREGGIMTVIFATADWRHLNLIGFCPAGGQLTATSEAISLPAHLTSSTIQWPCTALQATPPFDPDLSYGCCHSVPSVYPYLVC